MNLSIYRFYTIKYCLALLVCIAALALPRFCFANSPFLVVINDVDKKIISEYLVNNFVIDGYNVINVNEYQLTVRKDLKSFGAALFGSNFNRTPELRAHFNLVQNGSNTTITAEVKIVTNPNSGFETYTAVTNKSWQAYLNSVKKYFNGYIGYGLSWADKKKDGCLVVTHVAPEGPADKSGIKVGDLIDKVNSTTIKNTKMKKIDEIFSAGSTGTVLSVSLKNSLKEKTLIMTKGFVAPVYEKSADDFQQSGQKPVFGLTNGPADASGNILIAAVTPGSSADRAGLQTGDKIILINGRLASQYTPGEFNEAFSGPAGTKVTLNIVSVDGMEKTVTLEKTYIIQQNDL